MKRLKTLPIFASLISTCALVADGLGGSLAKELEPLKPFVGKTWKGPLKSPDAGKQSNDVMKWERALNGQAIRILHSVNDGEYGGESVITWNRKTERLEFYYFTTAGYQTHGTMTVEGGKLVSHEEVTGHQNGVTAVKAITQILPDGRMHLKSRYLKNGEWVDGHEITYQETPGAEVKFK